VCATLFRWRPACYRYRITFSGASLRTTTNGTGSPRPEAPESHRRREQIRYRNEAGRGRRDPVSPGDTHRRDSHLSWAPASIRPQSTGTPWWSSWIWWERLCFGAQSIFWLELVNRVNLTASATIPCTAEHFDATTKPDRPTSLARNGIATSDRPRIRPSDEPRPRRRRAQRRRHPVRAAIHLRPSVRCRMRRSGSFSDLYWPWPVNDDYGHEAARCPVVWMKAGGGSSLPKSTALTRMG